MHDKKTKNKKRIVKIIGNKSLIPATQQINPTNNKDTAIIYSGKKQEIFITNFKEWIYNEEKRKRKKNHMCIPKPREGRLKFRIQQNNWQATVLGSIITTNPIIVQKLHLSLLWKWKCPFKWSVQYKLYRAAPTTCNK